MHALKKIKDDDDPQKISVCRYYVRPPHFDAEIKELQVLIYFCSYHV
jgi:hypothetical protein